MQYQVWYMKPEFFRAGICGTLPQANHLIETHVHLKTIEVNSLDTVYHQMQGEVWSPNGEAKALLDSKGLWHTSMSVGDVIVDDVGNAHVVAPVGFKGIGGLPLSNYLAAALKPQEKK